jgi:hypothetical protein
MRERFYNVTSEQTLQICARYGADLNSSDARPTFGADLGPEVCTHVWYSTFNGDLWICVCCGKPQLEESR